MNAYALLPRSDPAILDPVQASSGAGRGDSELKRLSEILDAFNVLFGNAEWKDEERIRRRITVEVPAKVAEDANYRTAVAHNDEGNAKLALVDVLGRMMLGLVAEETQLFKEYPDTPDFKRWLENAVFAEGSAPTPPGTAALPRVRTSERPVVDP